MEQCGRPPAGAARGLGNGVRAPWRACTYVRAAMGLKYHPRQENNWFKPVGGLFRDARSSRHTGSGVAMACTRQPYRRLASLAPLLSCPSYAHMGGSSMPGGVEPEAMMTYGDCCEWSSCCQRCRRSWASSAGRWPRVGVTGSVIIVACNDALGPGKSVRRHCRLTEPPDDTITLHYNPAPPLPQANVGGSAMMHCVGRA